jgi:hypothetical protein
VGDNIVYVVMNWLSVIIICFFCVVTRRGKQNWQHNNVYRVTSVGYGHYRQKLLGTNFCW